MFQQIEKYSEKRMTGIEQKERLFSYVYVALKMNEVEM